MNFDGTPLSDDDYSSSEEYPNHDPDMCYCALSMEMKTGSTYWNDELPLLCARCRSVLNIHYEDKHKDSTDDDDEELYFDLSEIKGGGPGRLPKKTLPQRSQTGSFISSQTDSFKSCTPEENVQGWGGQRQNTGPKVKEPTKQGAWKKEQAQIFGEHSQISDFSSTSTVSRGGFRKNAGRTKNKGPGGRPANPENLVAEEHLPSKTVGQHGGKRSGAGHPPKDTTKSATKPHNEEESDEDEDVYSSLSNLAVRPAATPKIVKKYALMLPDLSEQPIGPHKTAIGQIGEFVQLPYYDQNWWGHVATNLNNILQRKATTFSALRGEVGNLFSTRALEELFSRKWEMKPDDFLTQLLPDMAELALALPKLITSPIHLLKEQPINGTKVTLFNRLQVASLLANAFFCTFQENKRDSTSANRTFNIINFSNMHVNTDVVTLEKFKCILLYFDTLIIKKQWWQQELVYYRHAVADRSWSQENRRTLGPLNCYVEKIEDGGIDRLHVDFANKFIGGGVLARGSVQEEIRFVICPELIVSCLLCEVMHSPEAVMVQNVRRYSHYTGYAKTFRWSPDAVHPQINDVVAIDALPFAKPNENWQFEKLHLDRELRKAYAGFTVPSDEADKKGIATGHWGGGVFGGDKQLKCLIQWMASTLAGRTLNYFTFGDQKFAEDLATLVECFHHKKITVAQLYNGIINYGNFFQGDKYPYSVGLFNYLSSSLMPEYRITFSNQY